MKKTTKIKYPFTLANTFNHHYIKHLTADFETCKTADGKDVRVWAWGIADIFTYNFEHGNDIETFMSRLLTDDKIYDVAIHNLKFDGNFILPYLYKNGYQYLDNATFTQKWANKEDLRGCFTHNITVMGQWFSLTIVKATYATGATPAFVHFWDTLKLFTQTLKEVGEQYCSEFKKLDEDQAFYEAIRAPGHTLTSEELHYLRNDCLVLAEALRAQYERYDTIYRTRASKAFKHFKDECYNVEAGKNYYKMKYEGLQQYRVPKIPGLEDLEGAVFRFLPKEAKDKIRRSKAELIKDFEYYIPDYKTWCELKGSYRGGISFVNPLYKELSINKTITTIDVNSMYPSVLRNKPLPYGRVFKRKGKPNCEMWIACARVSFKLKHDYNLPCIQIKETYGREWLAESTDYRKYGYCDKYNEDYLTFTSVDYETFCENYEFTVHEWLYHYEFNQFGVDDGQKFVDKYYPQKLEADRVIKQLKKQYNGNADEYERDPTYIKAQLDRLEAKTIINSAYGKFGTRYILQSKDSYLDPETGIVSFTGEVINFNKEPDDPSHYYLPYASFTTSYARQMLVRAWNTFEGRAVYCDTDSIHFIGTADTIPESLKPLVDFDATGELGLWKVEGEFVKARYLRAKTYIEVEADGKYNIVCAGATKSVKEVMTWDNFRVGFDAWEACKHMGVNPDDHSKLKPKHYPNGVDLVGENFQIKA